MPSSTKWRQSATTFAQRPPSPARPTAIEDLFDESYSFHALDAHNSWNAQRNNGYTVQGLGVSYDTPLGTGSHSAATPYFYTDNRGRAQFTPPAAKGRYADGDEKPIQQWHSNGSPHSITNKRKRTEGHTRSRSTLEDLATVAASPILQNGSPNGPYSNRPSTSYINGYRFEGAQRSPKRYKSERLPQAEWQTSPQPSRPATSHVTEPTSREEAELLLALLKPVHFSPTQTSPTSQFTQYRSPHTQPPSAIPSTIYAEDSNTPLVLDPTQHESVWEKHAENINGIRAISSTMLSPKEAHATVSVLPENAFESILDQSTIHSDSACLDNGAPTLEQTTKVESDIDSEKQRAREPKKQRRIKPEVQQNACVACNKMQSESVNNDEKFANNWISCNACEKWYHSACVGFKDKREVQGVDKFICGRCEPEYGATTFVRKSSRARTAIDYAGLNQGVVKSSAETALHHYIQPIKDGTFKFQPDEFARIRPEFVTAETIEKTDGIKRPFVVPAMWNPRFGDISLDERGDLVQDVEDAYETAIGSEGELKLKINDSGMSREEVVECDQDLLDMVMPRELTVRKVAELYGAQEKVSVIDVKSQQSGLKWTLQKWADYYESSGEKDVCNVISLEVSHSKMGRLIRRPKVVRDLDLQDAVWPADVGNRKFVAFYCLMSVADSYTDFHIDFGGSSVYYHILKGRKTFFFIPPEDKNLKKYEDWCNSDTQATTFLPDLCGGNCIRVDLYPGDTAFIPAGWIHAVWTPEDSLVIGGNFLTRLNYEMQFKVFNIEKDTKVEQSFRYPSFQKVMWFTLIDYLNNDPLPQKVLDDFLEDEEYLFLRANPVWHEFGPLSNEKEPGDEEFNARFYPKPEIEGLPSLRDYLYRTALIASDMHVPDVTREAARRVKASIPKGHGEPLDLIRRFGIWCAWKIGNVQAPEWTRSAEGESLRPSMQRQSVKAEPTRVPPERQSTRVASLGLQADQARTMMALETPPASLSQSTHKADPSTPNGPKHATSARFSGLGPKRVACEPCRKRRIKCRHKEEGESQVVPSISVDTSRPRITSNAETDLPKQALVPGSDLSTLDRLTQDSTPHASANIAQAALAMSDRHSSPIDANGLSSNKKGRSKACDECRKSKRRCVHDEHGRVDPAKVAEPSKPRGSAAAKRPARISNDFESDMKRPRLDIAQRSSVNSFEGLIDPALMMTTAPQLVAENLLVPDDSRITDAAEDANGVSTEDMVEATDFAVQPDSLSSPFATQMDQHSANSSLKSPTMIKSEHEIETVQLQPLQTQVNGGSLVSPPDSTGNDGDESGTAAEEDKPSFSPTETIERPNSLSTPTSASRQSSRQPKQIDRFVPEVFKAKPPSSTGHHSEEHRRGSSSTLTSGPSRRSSSNTSGMMDPPVSKIDAVRASSQSVAEAEEDMDERLARELQAQENGLRRRSGRG